MAKTIRYSIYSLLLMLLVSCGGNNRPAPLRNLSVDPVNQKLWKSGHYKVQKSDTLYSISFKFGLDFQQLARINQIKPPYTIYTGQRLKLRYSAKNKNIAAQQNKMPVKTESYSKNTGLRPISTFDNKKTVTAWKWPVKNNALKKLKSGKDVQQGINFVGSLGEPILAAADGRVVYSGNGLVGYGNLIIIKHSQTYLSAYAHNNKLLVSEKQVVKAGQKIATMGKNDTGQIQLHFEIRYQGRPVNPLKYLPSTD